jgi:hypothetical protein
VKRLKRPFENALLQIRRFSPTTRLACHKFLTPPPLNHPSLTPASLIPPSLVCMTRDSGGMGVWVRPLFRASLCALAQLFAFPQHLPADPCSAPVGAKAPLTLEEVVEDTLREKPAKDAV